MEMKRVEIMRLLRYAGLRLALIFLVALSLSVGLIAIRKVPHSSFSPAPTGNATCDDSFTTLELSCDGYLLFPSCCPWIEASFAYHPSCYCLFAELNVTTMYYLIGRCKADVPPTVSACLSSLASGSIPALSPPPPLQSTSPSPPQSANNSPPSSSAANVSPPPPSTPIRLMLLLTAFAALMLITIQ